MAERDRAWRRRRRRPRRPRRPDGPVLGVEAVDRRDPERRQDRGEREAGRRPRTAPSSVRPRARRGRAPRKSAAQVTALADTWASRAIVTLASAIPASSAATTVRRARGCARSPPDAPVQDEDADHEDEYDEAERSQTPAGPGPVRADVPRGWVSRTSAACTVSGSPPSVDAGSGSGSGSPSTSSKRTTVMLSSPPCGVCRGDQGLAGRYGVALGGEDRGGDSSAPSMSVRPSEQRRKRSPRLGGQRRRCRRRSRSPFPTARVIADRCGWRSASSGSARRLRTSSATSEWSVVTCSSSLSAQPVGAGVADLPEYDRSPAGDPRTRPSPSCPSRRCADPSPTLPDRDGSPLRWLLRG